MRYSNMSYDSLLSLLEPRAPIYEKKLNKFINHLNSFCQVPGTRERAYRMKKYAEDEEIVEFVLKNMKMVDLSAEWKPLTLGYIEYWFCLSLLCLSVNEDATHFVIEHCDRYLSDELENLWLLRRLLIQLDIEHLASTNDKVRSYFLLKEREADTFLWANHIGLQLPENEDWWAEITTERPAKKSSEESLTLKIQLFPLQENDCWEIYINHCKGGSLGRWCNSQEPKINKNPLNSQQSLLNLERIFKEIKHNTGLTFDLNNVNIHGSRNIKNRKSIKIWLSKFDI